MNISLSKYFLAANSAEGFVSVFKESYNPIEGWCAYIIKGGPGTGKSSFMRLIANKATDKGIKTQLFPCSSDPDSLDAVIFPDKKTVIMDGTSPHTVDPDYPAICETIFNFGSYWNENLLKEKSSEVIDVTKQNKAFHKTASEYIKSAGILIKENYNNASSATNTLKAELFAEKLTKKLIPKGGGKGYEWVRFLSGITPKGIVSLSDSVLTECSKTVIISDKYGAVSNIILNKIRNKAIESGYEIITVKNPLLPSLMLDSVIIPKLSLGIFREYGAVTFDSSIRRIHAERFTEFKKLDKKQIKFNTAQSEKLLNTASNTLKKAKEVHDELEKYYVSAMDFEALKNFADNFSQKIFND